MVDKRLGIGGDGQWAGVGRVGRVLGVGMPGQKLADMEDGVNTRHGGWKREAVSDGADDLRDGEGANEAIPELGGGLFAEAEVAGFQFDMVTNSKREGAAGAIGIGFLSSLGHSEVGGDQLMDRADLLKVVTRGGVGGEGGGDGQGGVGIVAIVGIEGRDTSGLIDVVIESELGDGKELRPIIMEGVGVGTNDLLDGAVGALGLAISLGMVGSRNVELGAEGVEKRAPKR